MKLLFEFFPILLFFAAYKMYDIYVATTVAMAASAAQVGWSWFRHRRVEKMPLITFALIVGLGGATLLLHDEKFIQWKPTLVNWAFALVFLGSQYIGKQPLLQRMMGENITLPDEIWTRLNLTWVTFFVALGAANLYVLTYFDLDTWVNFKLFGMLGLTVLFVIGQGFYLMRHVKPESKAEGEG